MEMTYDTRIPDYLAEISLRNNYDASSKRIWHRITDWRKKRALRRTADFLETAPESLSYPTAFDPRKLLTMHSETLRGVANGENVSMERVDMCYSFLKKLGEPV